MTKLKDLLPDHEVHIEYRTRGPEGQDWLSGFCFWDGAELIGADKDNYSVNDDIETFEWDGKKNLIVWYKSRWITG